MRIKNKILKGLTMISAIAFILSACALDSKSMIPLVICIIAAIWLALIAAANTRG